MRQLLKSHCYETLRVNRLQETPLFQNEDTNDLLMERGEKGFEKRPNPIIYTEVAKKLRVYAREPREGLM